MSDTDSFIEEVSEEVRRDALFGYFRRYGWIAITAVVLLVGGAAYNEYSKAQTAAAAQARGDAILTALQAEAGATRAEILGKIDTDAGTAPVVGMLLAGESLTAEDKAAAITALKAIVDDGSQTQIYRDLASLKLAILNTGETDPADRIAMLTPLAVPGAAFRVLAEEQIALAEIEKGDIDAAVTRLRALLEDAESTQGLRVRAQQLIVALGKDVEPT